MDDKAHFHDIQSKLENYLYEYKKSFPKNIWQFISVDFPLITLIVSALVTIELIGIGFFSSILILLLSIPYLLFRFSNSNEEWNNLRAKRKKHKEYNKCIINKINKIETQDLQNFPDIKIYLENYHRELDAEIARKKSIKIKAIIIMIGGMICFSGFCYFSFNSETKLWFLREKKGKNEKNKIERITPDNITNSPIDNHRECFDALNLSPKKPVATIKPLSNDKNMEIKLYFKEYFYSYYRAVVPTAIIPKSSHYLITITDTQGKAVNGTPVFYFTVWPDRNTPYFLIESSQITLENEHHPYEIIRRVRYLQDNEDDLRYTIEEIPKPFSELPSKTTATSLPIL